LEIEEALLQVVDLIMTALVLVVVEQERQLQIVTTLFKEMVVTADLQVF
jgi:hypothetical protein